MKLKTPKHKTAWTRKLFLFKEKSCGIQSFQIYKQLFLKGTLCLAEFLLFTRWKSLFSPLLTLFPFFKVVCIICLFLSAFRVLQKLLNVVAHVSNASTQESEREFLAHQEWLNLSYSFYCCDKKLWPKAIYRGNSLFPFTALWSHSATEGSQGKNSRQEHGGRNRDRSHREKLFTDLLLAACSDYFLI